MEYLDKTGKEVGIDLGLKNLATLSNGQEIANLDLTQEDKMIQKISTKIIQTRIHEPKLSKNTKKVL